MSSRNWTDERVSILTKLWLSGLSATECAKQLGGVTRNAVIGKVHRLGLVGRVEASPPARVKPPKPERRLTRPSRPVLVRPQGQPPAPVAPPAPPARAPILAEEPGTATIISLGAHMCKWPIGDPSSDGFTLCGRKRGGTTYCDEHARVAYQPRSPSELKRERRSLQRLASYR
jgi:GcrA cell cycle regulator